MSDRRKEERDDQHDRRDWPRPPLLLNLVLLCLAAALAVLAYTHDRSMEKEFQKVMIRGAETPAEMRRIREEVSKMDLTGEALKKELASRTAAIKSKKSSQFYISIDTQKRVFGLYYGNDLVREAPVTIGPPRTIATTDGTLSFPAFKGSVAVERKYEGLNWKVPQWVYVMNGQPVPSEPQRAANGIGEYIIELPNDYLIHSEPSADSPLKGPKPGSFMVPAETLRAIWPRVEQGTRVYIF
jgi:hypothetical protein